MDEMFDRNTVWSKQFFVVHKWFVVCVIHSVVL